MSLADPKINAPKINAPKINDGMDIQHKDVNIADRNRVYDGYRKIDSFIFTHRAMNPDAPKWLPEMQREMVCMHGASATLLYEPKTDMLLINRQFRLGAALLGYDNPFMLECSAGQIDEGETPEETSVREAFEETGAKVIDSEFVARVLPSSGSTTEDVYLYCACIDGIPKERYHGVAQEGEEIETTAMLVSKIEELMNEGKIHNSNTLILLNWFLRNHERLQKKWS